MYTPELLHRHIGEGRRPGDHQQPDEALDGGHDPQSSVGYHVAETERGIGGGGKIQIIVKLLAVCAQNVAKIAAMMRWRGGIWRRGNQDEARRRVS